MNGQLWQPCASRRCDEEPVCADCFLCETHCTCTEPQARTRPDPQDSEQAEQERRTREAALKAFLATLPPGQIRCEGRRLGHVRVGETVFHAPDGHWPQLFRAASTASGRPLTVCFYGNACVAYGDDAALDEVLLSAELPPLTPERAFEVLSASLHVTRGGSTHTGNVDSPRLLRLLGGEQALADLARTREVLLPYTVYGSAGHRHDDAQLQAAQHYGVALQSLRFIGYLPGQAGQAGRSLYGDEQQRLYSVQTGHSDWQLEPGAP